MSLRPLLAIVPLSDAHVALRRPKASDVDVIAQYIHGEDAKAWLSGSQDANDLYSEYAGGWNAPDQPNRLGLTVAVTRSGEDALVGVLHLERSDRVLHVVYGVAPAYRRRGVASAALTLCSGWAIGSGFDRVELEIGEGNDASQGVARRCGFTSTARTRTQRLPDGSEWHARAWCLEP